MRISFSLSTWLALLICFAGVAATSLFYSIHLKGQSLKLRVTLVSLRAACALGLLLIILDATIIRSERNRRRLLITTSDSPLMRLPGAGGGQSRSDQAEALSRSLSNDARLAAAFVINRATGADQAKAALAGDEQESGFVAAVVYITDGSDVSAQQAESFNRFARAPSFIASPFIAR